MSVCLVCDSPYYFVVCNQFTCFNMYFSFITCILVCIYDFVIRPLLMYVFQVGPTPALIKAEVPWSARRGNLSEKDRVLKTVKGYHNYRYSLFHVFVPF